MVIFLTGLVTIILMRTLRKDYARYAKTDADLESLEHDLSEVWKCGVLRAATCVYRPLRSSLPVFHPVLLDALEADQLTVTGRDQQIVFPWERSPGI